MRCQARPRCSQPGIDGIVQQADLAVDERAGVTDCGARRDAVAAPIEKFLAPEHEKEATRPAGFERSQRSDALSRVEALYSFQRTSNAWMSSQ